MCEEFLITTTDQSPPTKDLCQLIHLHVILEANTFIFDGGYYLQRQGTAMGTQVAPSYVNLFMGKFEQQFLQTQDMLPLVWWRYRDDVFAIWTHGVTYLNEFVRELNNYHTTLKVTANWSIEEITFLDTWVYRENGKVEMALHVKPTKMHQYLHTKNCHPKHCNTAILCSQALRIIRICSKRENLSLQINQLKHHLSKRGYSRQLLDFETNQAINTPEVSSPLCSNKQSLDCVTLVVTYHPHLPILERTIRCYHHILQDSEQLNKAIPSLPIIASRRPRNL